MIVSTLIKATIKFEKSFWIAVFERADKNRYAAARTIFGDEPTEPEIYEYISTHFYQLKFTEPQNFQLIIKRKNYKRMQRDVRKEMEAAKLKLSKSTHADDGCFLRKEATSCRGSCYTYFHDHNDSRCYYFLCCRYID